MLPGKQIVAFTQPHDAAKLAALATKHGAKTRVLGGWTAIAKTAAALDTVANATSHLADNALFAEAMNRLPSDALVRAYANGQRAPAAARVDPRRARDDVRAGSRALPLDQQAVRGFNVATTNFRWVAAAVTSTSDGLKLEAFARTDGLTAAGAPRYIVHPAPPYVPALVDEIPSGALAVVDFQVTPGTFENLDAAPGAARAALRRAERDRAAAAARHAARRRDGDLRAAGAADSRGDARHAADRHGRGVDDARHAARRAAVDEHVAEREALPRRRSAASSSSRRRSKGSTHFRGGGAKLSADPSFLAAKKQSGMRRHDDRASSTRT